jgi:hypothetical protein
MGMLYSLSARRFKENYADANKWSAVRVGGWENSTTGSSSGTLAYLLSNTTYKVYRLDTETPMIERFT